MSAYNSTMRRSLNPDENFVLHGRSTPYWEKPLYLNNSKLTNTTTRLSQHTYFDPEKYRDRHYVKSLGDLASNLQDLSLQFKQNMDKNVSFGDRLSSKMRNGSLHRDTEHAKLRDSKLSFSGKSLSEDESQWFRRRSKHLGDYLHSSLDFEKRPYTARYPTSSGEEEIYTRQKRKDFPLCTSDSLCLCYFPVTLSAPYELESVMPDLPSKKHIIHPKSAEMMKSAYRLKERNGVDKEYFMASEAPTTGTATALITSPYQCELARLRMERLRIEEDRLLELKRHEELERIRGPKEKWYESTGPDFHYESRKNTEMMRYTKHWEDILKYRDSLQRSSLELQKSYQAIS